MTKTMKFLVATPLALAVWAMHCYGQSEAEMREIQRALNKEVLEKPFSVEAEEKIDAYVKEAMKKDLKPEVTRAPDYWRPGYTCADIYGYGWRAYRNCRYYHRYYGRYW